MNWIRKFFLLCLRLGVLFFGVLSAGWMLGYGGGELDRMQLRAAFGAGKSLVDEFRVENGRLPSTNEYEWRAKPSGKRLGYDVASVDLLEAGREDYALAVDVLGIPPGAGSYLSGIWAGSSCE